MVGGGVGDWGDVRGSLLFGAESAACQHPRNAERPLSDGIIGPGEGKATYPGLAGAQGLGIEESGLQDRRSRI